jgi:hypothetical protein
MTLILAMTWRSPIHKGPWLYSKSCRMKRKRSGRISERYRTGFATDTNSARSLRGAKCPKSLAAPLPASGERCRPAIRPFLYVIVAGHGPPLGCRQKSARIGFFRRALFIRRDATPSHGREGENA